MQKQHLATFVFGALISMCQAQLPLLQAEGTYFVNASTKEKVVLKGINISNNAWGFYEWPESDSLEKAKVNPLIRARELKPFVFTSEDAARIAQLDGNVVRYCFNDELFRADNPKRHSNITQLRSHISQLGAKGFYSFVTMQINPGLDCHNDNYERLKPGNKRIPSPFESDSVFLLWRDTWQFVAKNLEDMDVVAGYELIVEPKRPALVDASEQDLINDYLEVIDSIRSVDKRHIVMVPEYNSREANPGEQYWNEIKGQMVIDQGEQGTIWGRNWLQMPKNIPNMVYVAHIYDPFEFTTGKIANSFSTVALQTIVKESADWVYNQNKPLYISEYGVNYHHTMKGDDAKRIEWLRTMHDAFDVNHISTTIWQYKDLLTPWVKMDETFGLWMHYYDETTIKSLSNGKVEYVDAATRDAAINSKIDPVLNQYFIQNGTFKTISMVANQSLMDELNRYFNSFPLGLDDDRKGQTHALYIFKEILYLQGLPISNGEMPIAILSLEGKTLWDTTAKVQEGTAQLRLDKLHPLPHVVLIKYGAKGEWTEKLFLD